MKNTRTYLIANLQTHKNHLGNFKIPAMESISFAANKMAVAARTDSREHLAVNTGYQCLIEPQLGRGKVF